MAELTVTEDGWIAQIIQARMAGEPAYALAKRIGAPPETLRRLWNHPTVTAPLREAVQAAAVDVRAALASKGLKAVEVLDEAMDCEAEEAGAHAVRVKAATAVLDRIGVGAKDAADVAGAAALGAAVGASMTPEDRARAYALFAARYAGLPGAGLPVRIDGEGNAE